MSSSSLSANLRATVLPRLAERLTGVNLYELARELAINTHVDGKLNKGWVGQTIERAAQLSGGNFAGRDGADFELKTTSLIFSNAGWHPKETIKITMLNPQKILDENFETSVLWEKLSRLILVGVHHKSVLECEVVHLAAVDVQDPELVNAVEIFWNDIKHTLCAGEIAEHHNLGTSDDFIQLRPTGDGKLWSTCPITGEKFPARAFYATKRFIERLLLPKASSNDELSAPSLF
jgi:DNA mismatch repair protein MutH